MTTLSDKLTQVNTTCTELWETSRSEACRTLLISKSSVNRSLKHWWIDQSATFVSTPKIKRDVIMIWWTIFTDHPVLKSKKHDTHLPISHTYLAGQPPVGTNPFRRVTTHHKVCHSTSLDLCGTVHHHSHACTVQWISSNYLLESEEEIPEDWV